MLEEWICNHSWKCHPEGSGKVTQIRINNCFFIDVSVRFSIYRSRKSHRMDKFIIAFIRQDFCPSAHVSLTKADITVNSSFRIHDILDKSKGTRFYLRLTKFLTSLYKTKNATLFAVVATEGRSYMLLNSHLHLGRICKDQVTRDWLETVIKEGWEAYMIVGIHTVKDAEVAHNHRNAFETKVSTQLPVDTLAAPGASTIAPGNIIDVDAAAKKWRAIGETSSFVAPGEQGIAIQYCKLKFKWFSSRTFESAYPLFCPVFTGQNRPYVWGTGVGPKPPREKLTGENPRK